MKLIMKNEKHYLLGIRKCSSGAFEHAWNLGKNLHKRKFDTKYYSNWFDKGIEEISLDTEEIISENANIKNHSGIFHLQSHTYEYNNLLENLKPELKIIYYLHAIIPYFYLNQKEKDLFKENKLEFSTIEKTISEKLSIREIAQLRLMNKANNLITICNEHKKFLEFMNINKPIHVFENVSDFSEYPLELIEKGKIEAKKLKEKFDSENVILYCGVLNKPKGSIGIFDAFKKINENFPTSKLILLGSGENDKKRFIEQNLFQENEIKNIEFVPWIDKKSQEGQTEFLKYYLASDVLIQPMITEELYSKAALDAMYLEIPTITCKSPYTIGSSKNSNEIFESFIFMKENPSKIKEITTKAKEKILRENNWNSYISRLEKILK